MVLSDTTNCTQCLGGCPTCSVDDPNICTSCIDGQYLDANELCQLCSTNCSLCDGDATICTGCAAGYELISGACYPVPDNCVGLTASVTCKACFSGYSLSSDSKSCVIDTTCNGTSTCSVCDAGYYLSSGKCLACSLPSNCLTCIADSPSSCFVCKNGYYRSSGTCSACFTGCAKCTSRTYCTEASPGYYVTFLPDKSKSGKVWTCKSPCATCSNN